MWASDVLNMFLNRYELMKTFMDIKVVISANHFFFLKLNSFDICRRKMKCSKLNYLPVLSLIFSSAVLSLRLVHILIQLTVFSFILISSCFHVYYSFLPKNAQTLSILLESVILFDPNLYPRYYKQWDSTKIKQYIDKFCTVIRDVEGKMIVFCRASNKLLLLTPVLQKLEVQRA